MPDQDSLFDEPPARSAGISAPEAGAARPETGNDPSGHRARLRKRLIEGGTEALADHEVIELLLMQAVPRRDMKPLARSLIQRFGSLAAVLQTDPRTLAAHPGMGEATAAALRIVTVAATRLARQRLREMPVIGSWQVLVDYLRIDMAHLTRERVRVLYLNAKNMLLLDEMVGEGSIDEAAIHPREVIRRALDLGATGLILVHNHPSGSPEPSRADIDMTHRIAAAGRILGVEVHDHVVIGCEGHVSMRAQGLI
ncbi:DNA repair protein RadC [Novosphingobium sp. BL-8H]|uniref:RadC family protein n=1 Tax=Novosphingobium sp. BL-8H TaxID=3127640 RepID=UPI003757A842